MIATRCSAAFLVEGFASRTYMDYPGVGIGVYVRKDGKVLMGLRKGRYAPGDWCAPGGKMEMNESPEECARRETREEAGIEIENLRFITITNDIHPVGTHYVTISYVADWKSGEVRVMEPDKCAEWEWFSWDELPEPLFLSTRNFVKTGYNPMR